MGEKVLNFLSGAAAQIVDAGDTVLSSRTGRLRFQLLNQVNDAVAVGDHRRNVQIKLVEQLRKNRTALVWITQHHADHFIVTGVTQRLMIRPVNKWRTKHQRMQLALDVAAVYRLLVQRNDGSRFFKPLHQRIHGWNDGFLHLHEDFALCLNAVSRGQGAHTQLHLLHPTAQIRQHGMHVRHHDFELRHDAVAFFCLTQKLGKLGQQAAFVLRRGEDVNVDPSLI